MADETKQNIKVEKKEESKIELEREYIVPLREGIMKAPEYKRAKKAVRVLKEFIAKHMKVEDRDIRNVKINKYLNNEIWHRGKTNPPTKLKVKAVKKDGIVYVELAEIPKALQFKMDKDKKIAERSIQTQTPKVEKKEEKTDVQKQEEKEKEKATVEGMQKIEKKAAKQEKHTTNAKQGKEQVHRMALQK